MKAGGRRTLAWAATIVFVALTLAAVFAGDILEATFFLGMGLLFESGSLGLGQQGQRWRNGLACSAIVLMLGGLIGYFWGWY